MILICPFIPTPKFTASLAEHPRFVRLSVDFKNSFHVDDINIIPLHSESKEFYDIFRSLFAWIAVYVSREASPTQT